MWVNANVFVADSEYFLMRITHSEVFLKIGFLKIFGKILGKQQGWSLNLVRLKVFFLKLY